MRSTFLWGMAALLLVACDQAEQRNYEPQYGPTTEETRPEYSFGVHPQRNPEKLYEVFGPVTDYLNAQLPDVLFIFEASRHYDSFDEKIAARHFDFLLPNPYETLLAIDRGYRVFAKMGRDADLRGLIVVRRDSDIRQVEDLRGKAVSFPAPTALAATMLPKYFLQTRGLDIRRDIEARYVGSMESSLLNILRRNVAAGTVYPPAWRMFLKERPALADDLMVLWETDSLPNNSVMARDDVPPALVQRVKQALVTMHENPMGRRILEGMDSPYFEEANNTTYDPVRTFLQRYRDAFGKGE
jgi:phosphonate transport system substrate-binding protein